MKIIVGLGNPGKEFQHTRHNIGFQVIDQLVKELSGSWRESKKYSYSRAKVGEWRFIKPLSYMNRSGEVVKKVVSDFGARASDLSYLWVIHDDLDLPLGTIRTRLGGSSGGHNGVQSIIDSLGTDQFWRIRIGIGRATAESKIKNQELYVLSPFSDQEKPLVDKASVRTTARVLQYLKRQYIVGETITIGD